MRRKSRTRSKKKRSLICADSGSINSDTGMEALLILAMVLASFFFCETTSSPPSVVSSCLFSGTRVTRSGLISRAKLMISLAAPISRFSLVFTVSLKIRTSRSWICLLSSRRCTTIPRAPANSQMAAAATGSGSYSPGLTNGGNVIDVDG